MMMLRSLTEIKRFQLQGIDEEIGRCKDFLFDDKFWVIRYMVADTNKWLPGGRKVLISPISLGEPDWQQHKFSINLSRNGIKNSPSLDEHQPISHQYEVALFKYYGYGYYWMDKGLWGNSSRSTPLVDKNTLEDTAEIKAEDRHLRSTDEVKGYRVHATDQEIGHIDDFILNDDNWAMPYLVIDTRNWFPGGRKILISHELIKSINWADNSVTVNLNAHQIHKSPPFDSARLIDPQYEIHLRQYYAISQNSKYSGGLKDRL